MNDDIPNFIHVGNLPYGFSGDWNIIDIETGKRFIFQHQKLSENENNDAILSLDYNILYADQKLGLVGGYYSIYEKDGKFRGKCISTRPVYEFGRNIKIVYVPRTKVG